jgi:hypothetical protein
MKTNKMTKVWIAPDYDPTVKKAADKNNENMGMMELFSALCNR